MTTLLPPRPGERTRELVRIPFRHPRHPQLDRFVGQVGVIVEGATPDGGSLVRYGDDLAEVPGDVCLETVVVEQL